MTHKLSRGQTLAEKYSDLTDRCQCQICHKTFKSLCGHLWVHGLTANEYKDRFYLLKGLPLCADSICSALQQSAIRLKKVNLLYPGAFKNLSGNKPDGSGVRLMRSKLYEGKPKSFETKKKMRLVAIKRQRDKRGRFTFEQASLPLTRKENHDCL